MKRIALAALLCLGGSLAFAQAPEAPKPPAPEAPRHKCEPKPEFPGRLAMQSERSRTVFMRHVKTYETCMKAFVEERKAVMQANEAVIKAAIDEYNETVKQLNQAQKDSE